MVFIARYRFTGKFNLSSKKNLIPGRIYLHSSGFKEAAREDREKALLGPGKHALEVLVKNQKRFLESGIVFFRGATYWNEDKNRVLELFGYSGISEQKWPGNGERHPWIIIEGGIVAPSKDLWKPNPDICTDVEIAMGEEEKFRRITTFESYVYAQPPLGNLEPTEECYRNIEIIA